MFDSPLQVDPSRVEKRSRSDVPADVLDPVLLLMSQEDCARIALLRALQVTRASVHERGLVGSLCISGQHGGGGHREVHGGLDERALGRPVGDARARAPESAVVYSFRPLHQFGEHSQRFAQLRGTDHRGPAARTGVLRRLAVKETLPPVCRRLSP